jgi:hypothetical protein
MKISRNDPFNLNLTMRGLGNIVTYMHSHFYEYMYHFTFKRTLKSHSTDFRDPWEQVIEDIDFFKGVDDPFVRISYESSDRLLNFKGDLILRFGITEEDDLQDEVIINQSNRYQPYFLVSKRSKTYTKLKLYYIRAMNDYIQTLYNYACVLTASSYKIPQVLKKQFIMADKESLRLLNHDDSNVELIVNLIIGLKKDLEIFKGLAAISSKAKRDLYY